MDIPLGVMKLHFEMVFFLYMTAPEGFSKIMLVFIGQERLLRGLNAMVLSF